MREGRGGRLKRHLPNFLTTLRLAMAALLVWLMSFEGAVSSALALLTFIAAAATDWLDGTLARKYRVITPFGIFMDPLADKVLVLSALLVFLWQNVAPVWMCSSSWPGSSSSPV